MYESKKSIGRKDKYKYQKTSHQNNFHNTTHFVPHKYNKYKRKYIYSNVNKYDDEEIIFSQIFDEKNSSKNNDLKEIDEGKTPIINKTINGDKENLSINSNINEFTTAMKTKNDITESKIMEINDNILFFNDNNSFTIISKKSDKENEQKDEFFNNFNNSNFNISDNASYNVENVINDLLLKNNEITINSNENKNIHLEYNKNLIKTPQSFKNCSSNDIKESYYFPKNINTINDINITQQQPNIIKKYNSLKNFNFTSRQNTSISLSTSNNLNIRNLNLNYFKNNNNYNNNKFFNFNNGNNNLNISKNFNIPSSNNLSINSFNIFESNDIPNIKNIANLGNINNITNFGQCLNYNNNSQHNLNKNPFHNMMPQFELNKCILKTQINNNNLLEKDKENTDILEINVKLSEKEILTFKIRRYDDMFRTVKIFCEINKLDIKLIRPFIIYIIRALNSIYGIYNLHLKEDEIKFIKDIKKNFYNDDEENSDINDNDEDKQNNEIAKNVNKTNSCVFEDKNNCISQDLKENNMEDDNSLNENA